MKLNNFCKVSIQYLFSLVYNNTVAIYKYISGLLPGEWVIVWGGAIIIWEYIVQVEVVFRGVEGEEGQGDIIWGVMSRGLFKHKWSCHKAL